jgi:hypothetical protein
LCVDSISPGAPDVIPIRQAITQFSGALNDIPKA